MSAPGEAHGLDLAAVGRAAEAASAAMVDELREFVDIESPTSDRDATGRMAAVLAAKLEALGFDVAWHDGRPHGDHLKATHGDGPGQVLILSHVDTVWPVGTLESQPWRIEGDRIYGPGTADMKGGIVVALTALRILRELGRMPAHRITFLGTSDEETGSTTSRALIEAEARVSGRVLVTEPGDMQGGAVKTQRKGTGMFDVRVRGVRSHSGAAHRDGASAVSELARKILELDALTDYETGVTVNVGRVEGGQARNVVAGTAHAEVDLRVVTPEQAERLEPRILGLAATDPRTDVEVTGGISRPPMPRTPGVAALYAHAARCARELGFELPETSSGGGSDGNFAVAVGTPTLDGLGAVGAGIHATDEHVSASWLPKRAALFAALLHQPLEAAEVTP